MNAWLNFEAYMAWYEEFELPNPDTCFDKDMPVSVIGSEENEDFGECVHVTQDSKDWGQICALVPMRFISLDFVDNVQGG